MPVLFKRNSLSSMGGGGQTSDGTTTTTAAAAAATTTTTGYEKCQASGMQKPFGVKRPAEPTENEKVLASKTATQGLKLGERRRKQEIQVKVDAAAIIQRAWRYYVKKKRSLRHVQQFTQTSQGAIHRKRLQASQAEWERQIAALTIQLAWRKFFRRKLLKALHPNRRQLQLWDPDIVALKQQALIHYIYNEQLRAPFWHPTLKAPVRPLWLRFVPSAAAVSYNFAVDQYVPWVARLGAQPPFPDTTMDMMMTSQPQHSPPPPPQPQRPGSDVTSLTSNNSSSGRRHKGSNSKFDTRATQHRPKTSAAATTRKPTSGSSSGRRKS